LVPENLLGLLIAVQLGYHRADKTPKIMGFDVSNPNGLCRTLDHGSDGKGGKRLTGGTHVVPIVLIVTPIRLRNSSTAVKWIA
jgi:hypothetical protein